MAKKWQPREFIVALQKRINITKIQTRKIYDNQIAFEFNYKGNTFTLALIQYSYDDHYGFYKLFPGTYASNLQMGFFRDFTATDKLTMENVVNDLKRYTSRRR